MGRGEGCAIPKTEKFECVKSRAIPKPEKFLIPKSEKFDCSIGEGCAIPKFEKFECIEECVEGCAIPKPEKFECIGEGCAIPNPEKFVCEESTEEGHKCTELCVIGKELHDESLKAIPNLEKLLEIFNQIYQFNKNLGIRVSNRYKKIENQQKFEPKSEKFECIEEWNKIWRSENIEIRRNIASIKQFDDTMLEILNLFKQWVELDKIKEARKRKGVEVPERLGSKRVKPEE